MDQPNWLQNISFFSFPTSEKPLLKYVVVLLDEEEHPDLDITKWKFLLITILSISIVALISLVAPIVENFYAKHPVFWVSTQKHSLFETFGGLIAIIIGLILSWEYLVSGKKNIFLLVLAFFSMGILDLFHAHADYCHNTFVWLHSSSAFLGSIFFVGSTLVFDDEIDDEQSFAVRRFSLFTAIVLLLVYAILVIRFYHYIPDVLEIKLHHHTPVAEAKGNFTGFIHALNLSSSVFYLFTGIVFIRGFQKTNDLIYLIFGGSMLLFFESELLFAFSKLWNTAWWFWHAIKVLIFSALLLGLAFGFTRSFYRLHSSRKRLAEYLIEIERKNLELNKAYKNLKETQRYLTQSEQLASIGKMAATLAHEIKNPLGAISNSLGVLTKYTLFKEEDKELVKIIDNEMDRLNQLVEDFLSFSKQSPLKKKETDLDLLIKEALVLFSTNNNNDKPITIQKDLSEDLPLITIDRDRIKQLFINLLVNGIEAMEEGGIITVKTRHKKNDNEIEVTVNDTGAGISDEVLSHVFQPFFTTKNKGLGLGLNIVHKTVKEHEGVISISSKMGIGTQVQLNLPVAP